MGVLTVAGRMSGRPFPRVGDSGEQAKRFLMSLMRDAIGVLLAGGQGERLWPLTRDRAKPAVPFGGVYRIIDITLSNCINSDLRRVLFSLNTKPSASTAMCDAAGRP